MGTKSVLGLAGLFLASVALSSCENCGCFGHRAAATGYDHSTAIGMNGTTTTPTTMAQGAVPATSSTSVAGATPTTMGDPTAKAGSMSGYSSGTPTSSFGMPTNNVPAFTSPSTSGAPTYTRPVTGGTSPGYSNSTSGMSPMSITPATNRSLSPGSLDGANRFTVPPASNVPGTGVTPGATSGLTPSMPPPPPPVSSFTPGSSTVPTLKNTDE